MIYYKEGYKYQLAKTYTIQVGIAPIAGDSYSIMHLSLTRTGMLLIEKGYAWDGASGPTFDTCTSMRGSLVHDALYQLIRIGAVDENERRRVDEIFMKICIEDGMWAWRAKLWFHGVRLFAAYAARKDNEPKVLTAPGGANG